MVNVLVNNSFQKDLVLYGKNTRVFFGLYTKTHLWACTRLEKRGGLAGTRNCPKSRFQYKSMDLPPCP